MTAFLTIQEGCDKFCSFCVVPYTRGAEFSRPAEAILAEARDLAAKGVREITLLGQNVNAWSGDGGLAGLARRLGQIEGLDRIRYTTSHPADMDDALIAAHGENPALMPYLHLPVQAGSDRILKAMNRAHTADSYLRLVEKIRQQRPDIALSGDFIVGFPGEREADFEATLALVTEVGYAAAFSFKYSRRPGTPAAAKRVVEQIAERADQGLDIAEADIRVAIGQGRVGRGSAPGGLPSGKRGQVAPKTPGQARYLEVLARCDLVFGLGPAGTGKTFLAVAHGAGMLLRGEVERLIVSRPAVAGRASDGASVFSPSFA